MLRKALLVLLAILVVAGHAAAQEGRMGGGSPRFRTQAPPAESPVDWIFLIDTSKSMAELIDGVSILDRVKSTLREFMTLLRPNDTASAWVFDANSRRLSPRIVASRQELEQFAQKVADLQALGQWTHTGAALADGLREASEPPHESGQKVRPVAIVLLTDGREDVRGIPPADRVSVASAIRLVRDDRVPYVFYVSLGTTPDPTLLRFLEDLNSKAGGHGTLIADPGGHGLGPSVVRIRMTMVKPEPLQIKPAALALGRVFRGASVDAGFIDILSPVQAAVSVSVDAAPAGHLLTFDPPNPIAVGPGQWVRVRALLHLAGDATEEAAVYSVKIAPVDPPRELRSDGRIIPITVVVARSPWPILLLLLLLFLALATLAYFLLYWFMFGQRPHETPLGILLSHLFRRSADIRALPARLEAPDGTWQIPLEAAESVIDAAASSRLGAVAARVRLRSMGNTHDLGVIDGPVRWRRAGEPFEELPTDRTVALSHRAEIELGGGGGHPTILRYIGRRSGAPAPRPRVAKQQLR